MEAADLETKPSLTLKRRFPVAPEKVWRAWTDPEAIKKWFGPGGPEPVSVCDLDVRVGGRFRICFGGADGNEHEAQGVYKEVVPNRKLVFTWTWPRSTPERESVVTIEFRKAGAGTDLVFHHAGLFDETVRDNHLRGWRETMVKLERFLVEPPALHVARTYAAAPGRVWRAWTDPKALAQWFRPDASFSVAIAEADVRAGGRFRILMVAADGAEFDVSGTYREVVRETRLVMTWHWQQQPGHESLVTVEMRPEGKGTRLDLRHQGYLDFENRPTHEQGWNGALDKLGAILKGEVQS